MPHRRCYGQSMELMFGDKPIRRALRNSRDVRKLYRNSELLWQTTQFAEDFGAGVADWEYRFKTGTITNPEVAGTASGKVLEFKQDAGATAAAIVLRGATYQDVELRVKKRQLSGSALTIGVSARVGGTTAARQGYFLKIGGGTLGVTKFTGSGSSALTTANTSYPATVAATHTPGTWVNFAFRLVGPLLLGKAWADGAAEPADWMVGVEDASWPDAGELGLMQANATVESQAQSVSVKEIGDEAR